MNGSVSPAPAHNRIFERFLASDDEVLGLVAYGIYKKRKREWALQINAAHHRPPTAAELQQYHDAWTDGLIETARAQAEQVIAGYAGAAIAAAEPEILRSALKGSTSRDIAVSIAAAFLYTLLLIGLAVVLAYSGVDVLSILEKIRGSL